MGFQIKPKAYHCKYCGAPIKLSSKKGIVKCEYCGSEYMLCEENEVTEHSNASGKSIGAIVTSIGVFVVFCIMLVAMPEKEVRTKSASPDMETNFYSAGREETDDSAEYQEKRAIHEQFLEQAFRKDYDDITESDIQRIKYLQYYVDSADYNIIYRYAMDEYMPWEEEENLSKITLSIPKDSDFQMAKYSEYDFDEFLVEFTGLEAVKVSRHLLENVDLSTLPNLQGVIVDGDLNWKDLSAKTDGDRLEWMQIEDVTDLTGFPAFQKLTDIMLKESHATSIAPLTECSSLKKLRLIDNYDMSDYKELSQFAKVESLYLNAYYDQVKVLDSIGDMTSLQELTIEGTEITNLNFISGLSKLTSLCVRDNEVLEDFSALKGAAGLTDLTLDLYGQNGLEADLSSVYNLNGIRNLTLCSVHDKEILRNRANLETLHISFGDCYSAGEYLAEMKNLRELSMTRMFSLPKNFECLKEMPHLEKIDMSGNDFRTDMNSLFSIDQVQSLDLSNSTFYVDTTKVGQYTKLEKLNLCGVSLDNSYYDYDYSDTIYQEQPAMEDFLACFSDASDLKELDISFIPITSFLFLQSFPNLEKLYANSCELSEIPVENWTNLSHLKHLELADNKIPELQFTKNLTELEYLDITNCYVTDLSPTDSLTHLQILITDGNPL